jgi:hypothetical protein
MFRDLFFESLDVYNVEKYGIVVQDIVDSIIRRMRITCWISKATNTLSDYGNSY